MPLNASNFLMWFTDKESTTDSALPRPFVREAEVLSPAVWLLPGDVVTFYINTLDNTAAPGQLQIETERAGLVTIDSQKLGTITFPDGVHTYGTFTVPEMPMGMVRLRLNTLRTQWLWATSKEQAAQFTVMARFHNKGRRLQNYRYGYLPEGWSQQIRIRLAMRGADPGTNKGIYTESTTGKTRTTYSEPRKIVNLITPEYDENAHFAVVSMIEHDFIELNGRPYAFNSPYKSNMNEVDALTQGEFALSDEGFSSLIRT